MRERWRARFSKGAIIVVMLFALLACNFPGLKPTPDFEATAVVRTVSAGQTENALQTASPLSRTELPGEKTSTEIPTGMQGTATPTATPEPCLDRARLITDITIPDGTFFAPGAEFEKVWRLLNAGTCPWTTDYALIFDNGNSMSGDPLIPLSDRVVPGITVDLAIDLIAPQNNGSYEGNWMLRNDEGANFGLGIRGDKYFWVRINVGPTPTPAP